jgi:DNA-binding GntR family transcriptional regulator
MPVWSHGLRRRSVVQSILHSIFEGRYRSGQRLVVQRLADEYGVSPTPIREALVELSGIGILDLLPNRGAVVRAVTWQDVAELCQIRRVLEAEAARAAAESIDQPKVKALIAELKRLTKISEAGKPADITKFIEETRACDSRLHDLIATACGSRRLAEEISRYKMLFRAFRDVTYAKIGQHVSYEHMLQENIEHLAIATALAEQDGKGAAKAMSKHIEAVMRFWGQRIVDTLAGPEHGATPPSATSE